MGRPLLNEETTSIQEGYRGMKAREQMAKEEDEEIKKMEQKSRDIEDRLGISLDDPKVVEAATKIQAGFRGAQTRRNLKNPIIIVDKTETEYSEYESESSYTYEDEDEESESLQESPKTPKTAVEDFSQSIQSIAGFKPTAMIGSWVQRRKLRQKVLTSFEEDDMATKIQAGYRGMKTREDAKPKPPSIAGFRVSAHIANWAQKTKKRRKVTRPMTSTEEDDVATRIQSGFRGMTVREKMKMEEQQSHGQTTIHVLEVKRDEQKLKENKSGDSEGYSESFQYDSETQMEGSESEDESSESEEGVKVDKDKTPFALLKSLHGIMNIASSSSSLQ